MRKIKKRLPSKSKTHKFKNDLDEEISEDDDLIEGFDINEKRKNNNKNEGGELWKYIHENYNDDEENQDEFETSNLPIQIQEKNNQNQENNNEDDLKIDRLEDTLHLNGNILDFDQLNDNDSSYKWITQSNESNETYKKLIKKFKQIESDVPEILKSESQSRANRLERKTQYESLKKQLSKKWIPIITQINKKEGIIYGEDTDRNDPTPGTLYTTFKPETEFEKELSNSTHDKIKFIEGKALAKAILAREQKRNKRINRIKSKRWHKRQKQRDLQIAAKLLSKIDDPDLADEIKSTFERKRAEKRILRKKEAQSKWAKMALRYGGKELLKEISFQNQNLQNDYQLIDQVTKNNQQDNESESDEEYDDYNENNQEEALRESQQDKLNVILDSTLPIPEKGLFNLTFMKNAIINKREKEEQRRLDEDEEEDDMDEEYEDKDKENKEDKDEEEIVDYNVIVNHEGIEVDEQILKFNKLKDNNEERFTKEELDKAGEEIDEKLNNDQFSKYTSFEDRTSSRIKSVGYNQSYYTDKTNTQDTIVDIDDNKNKEKKNINKKENKKDKEIKEKKKQDNNKEEEIENKEEQTKEKEEKKDKRKILNVDSSFDEFIDTLDVSKENEENKKIVKEMFVTRPDEEQFLEDSEDENEEDKVASMAGWGSWTGYGIVEKKNEEEVKKVKKSKVKVNKKKDNKLAKYYIHNLPHPFNNRHEYNSKMDIPIGPEWNTINMHKKLVQPKTSVKIGSVIMPLGLGNDKHKQLLRDYDNDGIKILENKINPYINDICIRFQQISHTHLNNQQNRLCLEILKSIEKILDYISAELLFKFLISYSKVINSLVYILKNNNESNKFNLKISSNELCKKLFKCLEDKGFEINENNTIYLIETYIRLCIGYGEDVDKFSKLYNDSMKNIINEKVKLNENELDKLLLIFDRMGLYDKHFVVYYSEKIRKGFDYFNENQLGNFCRYMAKLPYIENKPTVSHIDLLKNKNKDKDKENKDIENILENNYCYKYEKKLPRYFIKSLLSRRSYKFKPMVDYSGSLTLSKQIEILKGWDFRNSKFIKYLNRRLPYVLHQYTYFNLIDIAEMFYVYDIKSNLLPRFATELWKYLYTLKYGYPIKSLIVLSCLKQGDAITYGRLIRNIPSMLSISWNPELVAQAMIACGSLGIRKSSIYNKMGEYLQKRIVYFKDPNLVCRIFESLSLAKVPQYGIYNQVITLSEAFPDWLHLKHLILIAKSCSEVGMLEDRLFRMMVSKMDQVDECSVSELIPLVKLIREVKLSQENSNELYKLILRFLQSINREEDISYEDLVYLLEGMVGIQVRTLEVEQLTLKVLRKLENNNNINSNEDSKESSSTDNNRENNNIINNSNKDNNIINNMDNDIDIVRILKYFSILGRVESKELIEMFGELILKNLKDFEDYELASLIWDMIAVGFELNSEVLIKVVNKFNQLNPRHINTHLLAVVGSLVKLSDCNHRVWKEYLKVVDGYKDYSWSTSNENIKIINSIANTIKDSKTFVKQYPFTIDITAMYKNIDGSHIYSSNISKEKEENKENKKNKNKEKKEMKEIEEKEKENKENEIKEEQTKEKGEMEEKKEGEEVALFYYKQEENPFILQLRPDGTHEQYFNFYCQTRKKILKSMGWKDTLIFSPNN